MDLLDHMAYLILPKFFCKWLCQFIFPPAANESSRYSKRSRKFLSNSIMNNCVCQINAPRSGEAVEYGRNYPQAKPLVKHAELSWTMKSSLQKQCSPLRPLSSIKVLAHFVIFVRSAPFVTCFLASPCARQSCGWTLNTRCVHVCGRHTASSAELDWSKDSDQRKT